MTGTCIEDDSRELEKAKENAVSALRQFVTLQATSTTVPDLDETASLLRHSITAETKYLIGEFRRSMESISALSLPLAAAETTDALTKEYSSSNLASSQFQSSAENLNVSIFLEKYSDKLVELVSEKIASKITNSER